MGKFVWRLKAKIVAIVDLVLVILGALVLVLFAALTGVVVYLAAENGDSIATIHEMKETRSSEIQPDITSMGYWTIGISVVILAVLVPPQIWAAVKLLKAARKDQVPAKAIEMALVWRNVTIGMCILAVIRSLAPINLLELILLATWRGASFYIVVNFIGELRSHLNAENCQPDNVVSEL